MKVICIDGSKHNHYGTSLIEGKVYEANPTTSHCGHPSYEIPEQSKIAITVCRCGVDHDLAIYNQKRFVPLSTIDETELLKERESNLINI